MNASPWVDQPMVPHAGPMAKQSMKYDDNLFGAPILASKLEICLCRSALLRVGCLS